MNKVVLLGFISQEPTTKEFPEKNTVMTKFSLAVSDLRNYNQSYFFNCIGWNQTADYISSNLHKGDYVAIDGRLTNRSYVNEHGAKVYITEIMIDNIKNLGARKPSAETTQSNQETNQKTQSDVVNVDELIDSNRQSVQDDSNDSSNNDVNDTEDVDWDME